MSKIIDGKSIASTIQNEVAQKINSIPKSKGKPGLAVILVGEDPASTVYVRMKGKACEKVGIYSITDRIPTTISESELLEKVMFYNRSADFHGLLVQLPLPSHINSQTIIEAIDPKKDVDCFHPYNIGKLVMGDPIFQPATPAGILELLKRDNIQTQGKHVVVLGRSNIVGKPISIMLAQKKEYANALVSIVHTAAKDISYFTRQADILIAAMGRPEIVAGDMVKEGVTVIDVGVNRVEADNEKGYRLVGDVKFDEVAKKAAAITPVPGGVGPMTIAMLLTNTLKAFDLLTKN
jgi:methylenetetrahydrofolate dehydrogenase (NADP+)/methenyltetrahydrofolate cyclohydrolase